MSVFKKLVSFLFEEEEEIYEEGELENIRVKEEHREPVVIRTQSEPPIRRSEEKIPSTQSKRVVEEPVQLPPQVDKHFTNIEIAKEEPVKTPQRAVRSTPARAPQRSVETKKPAEFEFIPVISPIFGADEHTKKAPAKSVTVPHDRVTQAVIAKKNPLGTIISPIYGATELAEFEIEARERIENKDIHAAQPVAFDNEEIDDEDDDVVSVSLEDLLASDEREDDEDLLQYSLFGDDEVVSMSGMNDSYKIKE